VKGLRILGDRRVELATLPRPDVREGWVVVRASMSAVCGSDLHHYRMDPAGVGHRTRLIAGHEAVGVVEEVGPGVEDLQVGTRVIVYQHYGCGRCAYCRIGEPMFCPDRQTLGNHIDGADGEYVLAPAAICLELPDGVSDEIAVLMSCSFGTAFSGIRKLGLGPGDVVVVFGLGPVGLCAVSAAADGAEVVAVDPVESRRHLAETLGASLTIDPTSADTKAAVLEFTRGQGAEASIDSSGNPRALSEALDVLRPLGRMVVLAATTPWSVDPGLIRRGGHTIIGSWVYGLGEYESLVRMAERKADSLARIITRRFDGDEGEDAFRAADSATEGKILIDWTRRA
jgi:threonine dehydrogenase-like Zn-dependent dehydrogenase